MSRQKPPPTDRKKITVTKRLNDILFGNIDNVIQDLLLLIKEEHKDALDVEIVRCVDYEYSWEELRVVRLETDTELKKRLAQTKNQLEAQQKSREMEIEKLKAKLIKLEQANLND